MASKQNTPAVPPVPPAAPAAVEKSNAKGPRIVPQLTAISTAVPIPQNLGKRGRGGNSLYPFERLEEVGQSFGVVNKSAKQIASVITGANKRYEVDAKDAEGKPIYKTIDVKQPDGTVIKAPSTEVEKIPGRVFQSADVDPKTDPDGASVRVWRVK